jgi:hypothetical protein
MTLLARFLAARAAWLAELDEWARRRLLRAYPGVPCGHLGRRALWRALWDSPPRPSAEVVAEWERAVEVERRRRRGLEM